MKGSCADSMMVWMRCSLARTRSKASRSSAVRSSTRCSSCALSCVQFARLLPQAAQQRVERGAQHLHLAGRRWRAATCASARPAPCWRAAPASVQQRTRDQRAPPASPARENSTASATPPRQHAALQLPHRLVGHAQCPGAPARVQPSPGERQVALARVHSPPGRCGRRASVSVHVAGAPGAARLAGSPACSGCPPAPAGRAARGRRATTISGSTVGARPAPNIACRTSLRPVPGHVRAQHAAGCRHLAAGRRRRRSAAGPSGEQGLGQQHRLVHVAQVLPAQRLRNQGRCDTSAPSSRPSVAARTMPSASVDADPGVVAVAVLAASSSACTASPVRQLRQPRGHQLHLAIALEHAAVQPAGRSGWPAPPGCVPMLEATSCAGGALDHQRQHHRQQHGQRRKASASQAPSVDRLAQGRHGRHHHRALRGRGRRCAPPRRVARPPPPRGSGASAPRSSGWRSGCGGRLVVEHPPLAAVAPAHQPVQPQQLAAGACSSTSLPCQSTCAGVPGPGALALQDALRHRRGLLQRRGVQAERAFHLAQLRGPQAAVAPAPGLQQPVHRLAQARGGAAFGRAAGAAIPATVAPARRAPRAA